MGEELQRQPKARTWPCVQGIEVFVTETDDNEKPFAVMSPRRWDPRRPPKKPSSCRPPQGAV